MKKTIFFILSFASIILLITSCAEKLDIQEANSVKNTITNDHSIPIETALCSLDSFLYERGSVKTRGGAVNYINNYFIVSRNSKTTKAADNESPVLYAVNFQDESGYALLSADDRIPEEIIAVTEQGNVTPEDFEPVTGDLLPSANDDLSVEEYNDMVSTGVLALQNNEINQQCLAYVEQYISYDGYNVEDQENSSSNETFHWAEVKSVPRLVNTPCGNRRLW